MSTYLNQYFGYTLNTALQIQSLYNLLTFGLVVIAAQFSDRLGRRPLLMTTAVGYLLLAIPCFYGLKTTGYSLCLLPLVILYCIEQATTPATIVEMFPPASRYTGISISYNTTMAVVSGTAPLLNTWLVATFNNPMVIAYYMMCGALISLPIIYSRLPKSFGHGRSLH